MIQIKIELIIFVAMRGLLGHYRSTGVEEMKVDKKKGYQEALKYIEEYITKSGFKLYNIMQQTRDFMFFLIKE